MSLDEEILSAGGRVDLESLPDAVQKELTPFDLVVREVLKEHEGVEFTWIRSADFWAVAGSACGVPTVALTYGVALAVKEAFLALLSVPELFSSAGPPESEEPWIKAPPHLGISTSLGDTTPFWRVPRGINRRKLAELVTTIACLFVVHHELAHIRRNHVQLAGRPFLVDGPQSISRTSDRMLEIDADFCGLLETARSEWISNGAQGEGSLITAIFSIGMTLFFLDRGLHVRDYETGPMPIRSIAFS